MALNREQKRMLRKRGELTEDGEPAQGQRRAPRAPAPNEQRVGAAEFAREVRAELRKVAWPTRSETINYSIIVLVTLVVLTTLVFAIDWVFSNAVLKLFEVS
jgi:preprotein translocase subunit SecE